MIKKALKTAYLIGKFVFTDQELKSLIKDIRILWAQ
jgi:hypothetical protein